MEQANRISTEELFIIWEDIMKNVRKRIIRASFIYVEDIDPLYFDASVFTVAVTTDISKTMIDTRFKDIIEEEISSRLGRPMKIEVQLIPDPREIHRIQEMHQNEEDGEDEFKNDTVNPKYTFDNFVIGSSNQYAHAAALATAEMPGYKYNPLFLYGHSGLGKTHLMHAIGNRIIQTRPHMKVVYVTSEKFTNDFINSLRDSTTESFRRIYREADVLMVDDVQFLTNKEATQEEFFHTFNELYNMNKQIVLTSDRMPKDLVTLEDRLRNRFGQGLTIDITLPDYETRMAILKKKTQLQKKDIPLDVLSYIAQNVKTNIRELEGALTSVTSLLDMKESQGASNISIMDVAKEALKNILPDVSVPEITPNQIMDKVCKYYNVTRDEILAKHRRREYLIPRQVAMYLFKELTDMNFVMIGREFQRDRTTVMSNLDVIDRALKNNDARLKEDIDTIIKELKEK